MIEKSAVNKQNFVNNLLFTSNARAAWEHILFSIKNENEVLKVLMPSYIGFTDREGSGVFDPLTSQRAEAKFYKINEDLSVDMEHFSKLIETKEFCAVLIIHYFGFCRNDMVRIKNLCLANNVVLVEDCAHAFHLHHENSLIGNYGDLSFYSLHKYLPTVSGGVLKNNSNQIVLAPLPDKKRINQSDLEHYAKSRFNDIADKRIRNYRAYEKHISKSENIEILYQLESSEIPQTFPVRIKNGMREKLYFYLLEKGCPTTALYYRLIDEIDHAEFSLSYIISNEILNLPVHQDTDIDDIVLLCKLIHDFFELGES